MDECGSREKRESLDWKNFDDLTTLSEDELKRGLKEVVAEEQALSYRRRILHGKIDLLRTELVRRGGLALSPEELARTLMGAEGTGAEGEGGTG